MVMCIECNKYFQNKSNLNRHMKLKHALDDNDDSKSSDNETEQETDVAEESSNDGSDASSSDESIVDVWNVIVNEAEDVVNGVVEEFKSRVDFCRSLKLDKTYRKIKETMQKAMDDEDMKFNEALDYAADKRRFLIARVARKVVQDEQANNDDNQDVNE
jgi:hypothetical protein